MPRKSKNPVETVETTEPKVAPAKKAPAKGKKTTKPKKEEKPVVETPQVEEKEEEEEEVEATPGGTKKRVVPTRDTVLESFDELSEYIDAEIARLREGQAKNKGIKVLRTINKRVKVLKSQTGRVMKQRPRTKRQNNNNSGFLKPVKISNEMAKFTGWDASELRSRVDVTKYICNYIKENNLQNPSDRRQILADAKLSKLLKYDSKKDDKPLTYYRIQTYMRDHFTRPEETA